MQQYIDAAQKVIPKNLTTYFNTVVGAFNIFQTMSNKFYPEYMEVQNAKNFQIDDPTVYSSIFQGNTQLENNKRKSRILKLSQSRELLSGQNKIHFQNFTIFYFINIHHNLQSFQMLAIIQQYLKLMLINLDLS